MRVFISWSGEQSRQIATALRDWLPVVLQAVRPYMSDRDNEAGSRWANVVSAELEASDFGIVCLTRSNLDSQWINFEAGALSKAVSTAHVVPLLHGLKNSDVGPPLSQFMMKPVSVTGIMDILMAMNHALDADRKLEEAALRTAFDAMWPSLKGRLDALPPDPEPDQQARKSPAGHLRSDRELLEEVLDLLRAGTRDATVTEQPRNMLSDEVSLAKYEELMHELRELNLGSVAVGRRHVLQRVPALDELDHETVVSLRHLGRRLYDIGITASVSSNVDQDTFDDKGILFAELPIPKPSNSGEDRPLNTPLQ